IKWVLLDFQVDKLDANARRTYRLVTKVPRAKPRTIITTRETTDSLMVNTGPMEVVLNKQKFDLFKAVRIGARDVLAPSGGSLVIRDLAGTLHSSAVETQPGFTVSITEAGPLRTVVRAFGDVQATEKDKLGFTCWYHFYAGSPYVRVFFTIRNLNGKAFTQTDQQSVQDMAYQRMVAAAPGNVSVEAVELVIPTKTSEGAVYIMGAQNPLTGKMAGGGIRLYQDSSAGWTWQVGDGKIVDRRIIENQKYMASIGKPNLPYYEYEPGFYKALTDKQNYVGCSFRGYRLFDDQDNLLGEGDRAQGWCLFDKVTVGVRWFWQMYPKSLVLKADGTITIGLWPKEWANPHVFEGHIHKTHELLFAFDSSSAPEEAASLFRRFDRRLLAVAPREHYCLSGAFNTWLMPENRNEYPKFEDWALTAIKDGVNTNINIAWDSSMEIEREKYDKYGVWHFGDTAKRGWRGFGQYLELDIPYCLIVHFVRTLNRGFFDEAEIHVRQLMDVPAHGGGYGHQKGESSHYYTSGPLFYYYLTGLQFIRESIKASHDAFARVAPWHARSFAITMWSNLDMFREFGDEETTLGQPWHFPEKPWKKGDYALNIQKDLEWFVGNPQRPAQDPLTGFRAYGQFNLQEFMLGMLMDALGRYCIEFPEQRQWRDRLVALANAIMEPLPEKGYKPEWLTVCNCNGLTYAYLFTGNDSYLDAAIQLLDKILAADDKTFPRYRTGSGAGKSWSEHGHRLIQTCVWARWHRSKHGTPPPPQPVTDLTATKATDATVELTWTAPKHPSGSADHYFIKLADKPFRNHLRTEAEAREATNWWTTEPVREAPPRPASPGEKQTMRIALPGGSRPIYVALRSAKQVGPITVVSDLSNVAKIEP
ncbi:MAG: fibronectin type III domain-containing protein, partial [Kiritimatiellae bacterium]|nr:fibronectin type III domain-containing protein [Kiritimatiellia bacterium]